MGGYLKLTKKKMDSLTLNDKLNTFYLIIIIITFLCCSQKTKYNSAYALEYSINTIGEKEYEKVVNYVLDSIKSIEELYPEVYGFYTFEDYKFSPKFYFNKDLNRFTSAILKHGTDLSSVGWLLGFKNNGQWEFFKRNASQFIYNETLVNIDTSKTLMQNLEDYGDRTVSGGYLKKKKGSNEYEINDAFFKGYFEGYGWYSFEDSMADAEYLTAPDSFWVAKYMKKVKWREDKIAKIIAERDSLANIEKLKD